MTDAPDQPTPADDVMPVAGAAVASPAREGPPLCLVVDDEPSIRHFLSLILHGAGIDTVEFADGAALRKAPLPRPPDLIFHNISLESTDAIESMLALGKTGGRTAIQLMSNRGAAVLEHVKGIGTQQKLNMLPVLKKPFETDAVIRIVERLKLSSQTAAAVTVKLDEAVAKDWVEFWYQPKIDLRKKQLAGVEAFARIRHPQHGIALPGAFMPDASDEQVLKLAELAITHALKAGLNFAKLGINLRVAINIPLPALVKLPVPDLVREHRAPTDKWPGLIIDITEEQIIADLAQATELHAQFESSNVRLAVDDFGKGYASLTRIKEMPFAELKLAREYVTDCGTDKVNAPLCKAVIDLAHGFGSTVVGIGIEKASDAVALVTMGCDYGQGFLLGQPMPEDRFVSLLRQRAAPSGQDAGKTAESTAA